MAASFDPSGTADMLSCRRDCGTWEAAVEFQSGCIRCNLCAIEEAIDYMVDHHKLGIPGLRKLLKRKRRELAEVWGMETENGA